VIHNHKFRNRGRGVAASPPFRTAVRVGRRGCITVLVSMITGRFKGVRDHAS
jgi:hypothetical protein